MAQTGDCQKCAADFGRTGPVCEHCRRETNLIDYMRSLTDWNIRIGEDGEPSYWYDAPCANALRKLQRWLGGARARALWRGGDATEAELLLLREEAEAEVAAWGAHRVGALPSDSDAGMKHEWLVARRCWREAGLLLLRLDEAQQAVATAELLPAGDDHLARRTAMREDEQRLHPLPSELPTLQLQSVTDEYEAAKELSKRESKIAFLLRCREQAWHVEPGAHDSAENSCSICLEPLRTPAPARGAAAGDAPAMLSITPCSHAFHAACLDRWLRRGASRGCPNCKAGVDPDDVRRATGLARDDGTVVSGARAARGGWGTKVSAIVSDVLNLVVGAGSRERAIVFSQWDELLHVVAAALEHNGVPVTRDVDAFKRGAGAGAEGAAAPRVLLLLIKKGAAGLTLNVAQHVFLLEPQLSLATEAQAIGRVHRVGQTRETTVHRYVALRTVEGRVCALRAARARAADGEAADSASASGPRASGSAGAPEALDLDELTKLFSEDGVVEDRDGAALV